MLSVDIEEGLWKKTAIPNAESGFLLAEFRLARNIIKFQCHFLSLFVVLSFQERFGPHP
jgi:hypothetical protein